MTTDLRIVIDTNTYISRLLAPGSVPAQAVDRAFNDATILLSDETLEELAGVLSRRKFDTYVSLDERKTFLRLVGSAAKIVPIHRHFHVCRDAKDDKFLDLAVNGEAGVIITGDKDLLALNPFHEVAIVTPAVYLRP